MPVSILGSSAPLSWTDVTLRALFLLGALTATGVFAFWLLMRRVFADELRGLVARLLFFALFTAFVGAGGLVQTATGGTRFADPREARGDRRGRRRGSRRPCRCPSRAAPGRRPVRRRTRSDTGVRRSRTRPRLTARGSRFRSIFCTSASAAVWIGGLLDAARRPPREGWGTTCSAERRRAGSRRSHSSPSVVLAASGVGRSLSELDSVGQLWSTSYGRALLVKTALFLPLSPSAG